MQATELHLPRSRRPVPTATRLRTRRLPVFGYVAVLLLLPVLVVSGAMAVGWWSAFAHTSSATSGGAVVAAPAEPADVRGSMTVQQVADAFPGLTVADVLAAFGAPAGTPAATQLKTLVQSGNGMEIPAFRAWLEQHATLRSPAESRDATP